MINPKLSEFCKSLTGIEQETVDKAEVFQDVLIRFESWMKSHGLGKCDFYLVFYSTFKTKKATMYDNQLDFLMELHLGQKVQKMVHMVCAWPHSETYGLKSAI